MLEKPSLTRLPGTLVSTLLTLMIMAFGSTANAQSSEATQADIASDIVEVDIAPNSTSGTANPSGENSSGLCERPQQWLYAETYKKGELASHGGKVWTVVRETKGDMPGKNTPPYWEHVKGHCSATSY